MKSGWQSLSQLLVTLIFASAIAGKADPLDNWTPANLDPTVVFGGGQGSLLRSVAYGNGRWVAVGQNNLDDNASIQTSEDSINWTLRTTGDYSILDLYDVTYGSNTFVAVGWDAFTGRNIYTSSNGIDWTSHTTALANLYAVAYGNGAFVAVGGSEKTNASGSTAQNVYYSSNSGVTWTAVSTGTPALWQDVAFGNNQFVVVDQIGHILPLFTAPRISNDLVAGNVSFCNGRFFIPAGAGTNLLSTNGILWTAVANNTDVRFGHVTYAGGIYLAFGGTNVFSSVDGTNWTQRNFQSIPNGIMTDLAFGDRDFVLTGYAFPSVPNIKPLAYLSDPLVSVTAGVSFPPQLTISGLTGRTYRVDFLTDFGSSNWQNLRNLNLTNGPVTWTDMQATNSSRFYRAVLLP